MHAVVSLTRLSSSASTEAPTSHAETAHLRKPCKEALRILEDEGCDCTVDMGMPHSFQKTRRDDLGPPFGKWAEVA